MSIIQYSRASYYKKTKKKNPVDPETHLIEKLFIENKRNYGTRRLKKACKAEGPSYQDDELDELCII